MPQVLLTHSILLGHSIITIHIPETGLGAQWAECLQMES